MTVLKLLKKDIVKAVEEYIALYKNQDDIPKSRQLDLISISEMIRDASDACELRIKIKKYANGLLSGSWTWFPVYSGSRLAKKLQAVLNAENYGEKAILQAQLKESQFKNTRVERDVDERWGVRIEKLELEYGVMSQKLESTEAEIARLRKENRFFLERIKQLQLEKITHQTEIKKLRQAVVLLHTGKTQATKELELLRAENQHFRELIDRVGVGVDLPSLPTYVPLH